MVSARGLSNKRAKRLNHTTKPAPSLPSKVAKFRLGSSVFKLASYGSFRFSDATARHDAGSKKAACLDPFLSTEMGSFLKFREVVIPPLAFSYVPLGAFNSLGLYLLDVQTSVCRQGC